MPDQIREHSFAAGRAHRFCYFAMALFIISECLHWGPVAIAATPPATAPREQTLAEQDKERSEKLEATLKAAEAGDATAMRKLGLLYRDGIGTVANADRAFDWFLKAHQKGDWQATELLAWTYQFGKGVPRDEKRAQQLHVESQALRSKAADAGDVEAMLAMAAANQIGIHPSYSQAARWYRKAADAGSAVAMRDLAGLYENGEKDLPQDLATAAELYGRAARIGDPESMMHLGLCYSNGRGVARDNTTAADWFGKGARAGDADAMLLAGICHEFGRGVIRDEKDARQSYQNAADQGNALASWILQKPTRSTTALLAHKLPRVNLAGVSMSDALGFIGDQVGSSFIIDWRGLDTVGVTRNTPIDYTAAAPSYEEALRAIMASAATKAKGGAKLELGLSGSCFILSTDDRIKSHARNWEKFHATLAVADLSVLYEAQHRVIQAVKFDNVALSEVLDFSHEMTGLPIEAQWDKLAVAGIPKDLLFSMSVRNDPLIVCLDMICLVLNDRVTFVAQDGKIVLMAS